MLDAKYETKNRAPAAPRGTALLAWWGVHSHPPIAGSIPETARKRGVARDTSRLDTLVSQHG